MVSPLKAPISPHQPVLYQYILQALQPHAGGLYVDGTIGAGGHAFGILEASSPDGQLLGLDVDPRALELASQKLAFFNERVFIKQASYTNLQEQLEAMGWKAVDGILLDLGISSMQLDTAERGFSFRIDGPLDMRFNPQNPVSAETLVNELTESELADLIYKYGEERYARRVAHAIVRARPLHSTQQLAQVVAGATRSGRFGLHPATRTFQALRIVVNQELQALENFLPLALTSLAPGGRIAIIAFHSLEDRIVKQFYRQESRDCLCPPQQPVCTCHHHAALQEITRRPIQARPEEVRLNPRAHSARLRVAEKLA
ncbi:MAG: 16S rRNA (cytosine(1402)-N(4))-methyltransferase RsmH [Anaerolineales bacterium]|nr:16S rRNA (cytosine(1402)-N(4))-methyltransferase RsmH [Anaerolineales bacterium]